MRHTETRMRHWLNHWKVVVSGRGSDTGHALARIITPPNHSIVHAPTWRLIRDRAVQGMNGRDPDRDRTLRAAFAAFGVRAASAAIAYMSQVALARWMGGFDYGVFVFVWIWVLILGGLSNCGLGIAMMRFVPAYLANGDAALLRGLLVGGRAFAFAVGTAIALLGLGAIWCFGGVLSHAFMLPASLALLCVPMVAVTDVQDGIGRSRQWIGLGLAPPYILRPLLLLILMGMAFGLDWPMTAPTAAACAIIATWVTALVQAVLLDRRMAGEAAAGDRSFEFPVWLKASLPVLMITGFDLVIQNTDIIVISAFMKPSDVGVYYAGVKTISLIAFVHYAVASAVANQFALLHVHHEEARLKRVIADAVSWTFWPSLAGAMILLALGLPLLSLFGPEFTAGYGPMFILAIGFVIKSAVGPAEFLLNMLGEQKRCGLVLIVTAAMDIALNLILVPRFGLPGAAAATALSLCVAALLYAWLAKRLLGYDIAIWARLRRVQEQPCRRLPVTLEPQGPASRMS